MITASRLLALGSSAALACASALHLSWGAGSSWPARDRRALADAAAGREEVPSALACFVVGGALAGAAAVVAGAGGRSTPARLARTAVATALIARGVTGVTGTTGRLAPWTPSARFVRLDRRRFGPLCLGIGAAVAASVITAPGRGRTTRSPGI
jgi:hypothetical protein